MKRDEKDGTHQIEFSGDALNAWLPSEDEGRDSHDAPIIPNRNSTESEDNKHEEGFYSFLEQQRKNASEKVSSPLEIRGKDFGSSSPVSSNALSAADIKAENSEEGSSTHHSIVNHLYGSKGKGGFSSVPLSPLQIPQVTENPLFYHYSDTEQENISNEPDAGQNPANESRHPPGDPELKDSDEIYEKKRRKHDLLFFRFYLVNMVTFLVIGFLNFAFSEGSVTSMGPLSKIYAFLAISNGILFTWILAYLIVQLIWVYLFYSYCEVILWSMIAVIPVSSILISVTCFRKLVFESPTPANVSLFLYIGLFLGILSTWVFYKYFDKLKDRVSVSIRVLRITTGIIKENPSIFLICYGLLLGYLIFIGTWFIFYAHLFLIGEGGKLGWQLLPGSYVLQVYFVAMLTWTTAVFESFQKVFLGHLVGRWYFLMGGSYYHEDMTFAKSVADSDTIDPESSLILVKERKISLVMESFRQTIIYDMGPICLSALILFICKAGRVAVRVYHAGKDALAKQTTNTLLFIMKPVDAALRTLEHIMNRYTSATLYYGAIRGTPYFVSGRRVATLFTRHFGWFITSDSLAHGVFFVASLLASLLVTTFLYTFDTSVFGKSLDNMSPLFVFLGLSFALFRFVTSCFTDTLDAAFLCYILDLDHECRTVEDFHQAFEAMVDSSVKFASNPSISVV